jgi:uncharacterized protein YcbX
MRLSEINIYPVKSLKGIALREATVEERGLQFDRKWMLVDEKGKFITQREFPAMARLETKVDHASLRVAVNGTQVEVPLADEPGENLRVAIWTSSVRSALYPPEINEWFSEALGTNCRLVVMPQSSKRSVNPFYAVRKFKDTVSFADGYPFMLIGEGSLADLNSRLDSPVPMNRFRPNLVVAGSEPFAEDTWKKIRIGSTVFHVVKPCGRCVITTIEQAAGDKTGTEPLKTLASYRTKNNKVLFGQNLIADEPGGILNVGDLVEVIEARK